MKVKFGESFITRLKTVGVTICLSRYKICKLVDKAAILDDSVQSLVDEGSISSIWNEETRNLDTTFLGSKKLLDENNKETLENPYIIYFYEDNKHETVEGPALVLFGDKYSTLGLTSRGFNHISIKFPGDTYSNIVNKIDGRNQKFLESSSNLTGTNVFVAISGRGGKDDLITRNSYLKYVRNKVSHDNIPTYLNKDGKKVFNKSWYKRYKKINLYASNLKENKDKNGTQNYILPSTSGTITINGECIYDLYEIKEGKFILSKENQVDDINHVALTSSNADSKFRVVDNKTIVYSDVEDSSATSFQGELYFKDEMREGMKMPLLSNKINLYQYSTWEKPSATTNLFESGNYMFLFDSDGKAIGTSSKNNNNHEITIRLKKRVDTNSINITPSSPLWNDYFKAEIKELSEDSKSGAHPYSIIISAKKVNEGKTWYPLSSGESTLMSCTISLGPNNKILFYCVQGPSLPIVIRDITRTNSLEKNSKGNFVGHLDGIIGKKKSDYYVTSEKLIEGYNTWVCSYSFFNESVNFVDRRSGKIEKTVGESGKISITSYDMPSTEVEREIGSLTFKRAPTSGEIDNTNWRDVMYANAGSCKLDLVMARDTSSSSYSTLTSSTQYFLKESDNSLKRLYMFDFEGKTFENTDNQDVAEHWFEFLVDESIPLGNIILESGRLEEFFNIKVESPVGSTKKAGWFRYRVIITAKGVNNSDSKWFPTNSLNEPEIIKAKIELKSSIKDHKIVEEFYCIQGFKIDRINVYVENKKPEWIELTGTHGVTSASNSGKDFEFEKQEDFDKYTSNDSNLGRHSVGDIITLGKIKSGIRRVEKFKMLVNTYQLYKKDSFIDFKSKDDIVNIALSKPINDYVHWKEVGIGSNLKVVSSNPDNLLNPEFIKIGDKYVMSNSNKDLPTAKYKIELKNLANPVKTHNITSSFIVDRVSDNTIKVEDLLSDWIYLMMKNNGVSTANVRTRVVSESSEDNIIVRTDDNKLWNGINVLPLDYVGIYRIFVSCPEDFVVTLSSNDSMHFIDDTTNRVLRGALSSDFDATYSEQFVPVYFTFEGGEKNSFRSPYQDLSTNIKISYKRDPSVSKTVTLRRYYIDSIPSEDGRNLGSSASAGTGKFLSSSITPFGIDQVSSSIVKSDVGRDIFCTYNKDNSTYSFDLAYVSKIEANLTTLIKSHGTKESVFDLLGFAGNKAKKNGKYDGSGKGYLYTKESVVYDEYPSKINQSYPIPVIDTARLEQVGSGKVIEYNVYNRLLEPRVSLSNYYSQPRYNDKVYVTPPSLSIFHQMNHKVPAEQRLFVDISVPGQSFVVKVLRGDGLKLSVNNSEKSRRYLNRYDKGPVTIDYIVTDRRSLKSDSDEYYIGTLEIESYIDKDNFILDNSRNVRAGNKTYSQDVVNLIAGTTRVVFDLYVGLGINAGIESSKTNHTFSQDFGGIIPAWGGKKTIELNPLFKNIIFSQSHNNAPFPNDNITQPITVESVFNKKFLNINFASREDRLGYNNGIDLVPSVESINSFCNNDNLSKILQLSNGRVDDNVSVTFIQEGEETGRFTFDSSQQNPSFVQEPYTHGIVISYVPLGENGEFDYSNTKSKLFVGANNSITIKYNTTYEAIANDIELKSHNLRITGIFAAIYPLYIASVELPTGDVTQFGKQSSDLISVTNLIPNVDSTISPLSSELKNFFSSIKDKIYNYYIYYYLGDNGFKDVSAVRSYRVSDSRGNYVTIRYELDLKSTE